MIVPISSRSRDGIDDADVLRDEAAWSRRHARVPVLARVEQRFHDRHAHGDAHLDLFLDHALRAVGDFRGDLDAAVHRARMHDQRVVLGRLQLFGIEAVEVEIFAHRGHEGAGHALALQPQHHHHVGVLQPFLHVVEDLDAHLLDAGRQQRRRRDDAHPRAHRVEQDDVGARDARMQDVAADRHDEPVELALGAADRQRVEQRLGRMLVRAVAGIDHRAGDLLRQQRRRAGDGVADDQDVGPHRVQRHRRVDQRLALLHRGIADRHVHHVGAKPLAGQFEGGLRARRGFEEQVDLREAAQGRRLLFLLARHVHVGVGAVEQGLDVGKGKPRHPEQVPVREYRKVGRCAHLKTCSMGIRPDPQAGIVLFLPRPQSPCRRAVCNLCATMKF